MYDIMNDDFSFQTVGCCFYFQVLLQTMTDLNSETWNGLRKLGYRANSVTNVLFGIGAYCATFGIQKKYGKWNKLSSLISSLSILGRCVSAGFLCIGVSSWLCSYYCFNNEYHKLLTNKMVQISNNHIFILKSSVLLFSISTYYCIALFSNLKIQTIEIPDINLKIAEISPKHFIITGSILATLMAIPTSLIFMDWMKDLILIYNNKKI